MTAASSASAPGARSSAILDGTDLNFTRRQGCDGLQIIDQEPDQSHGPEACICTRPWR